MKITNDMIDYQLTLINEQFTNTNYKVRVTKAYSYYMIVLDDVKTTGQRTLKSGLTKKQAYDMLEVFNNLYYFIEKEKEII